MITGGWMGAPWLGDGLTYQLKFADNVLFPTVFVLGRSAAKPCHVLSCHLGNESIAILNRAQAVPVPCHPGFYEPTGMVGMAKNSRYSRPNSDFFAGRADRILRLAPVGPTEFLDWRRSNQRNFGASGPDSWDPVGRSEAIRLLAE